MQFMEIESLKLDFHVDFFPHHTHPLTNRDLKTRVLDTRDANFQHCFETWQLTKFFYIYCYLARKISNTPFLVNFQVKVSSPSPLSIWEYRNSMKEQTFSCSQSSGAQQKWKFQLLLPLSEVDTMRSEIQVSLDAVHWMRLTWANDFYEIKHR